MEKSSEKENVSKEVLCNYLRNKNPICTFLNLKLTNISTEKRKFYKMSKATPECKKVQTEIHKMHSKGDTLGKPIISINNFGKTSVTLN